MCYDAKLFMPARQLMHTVTMMESLIIDWPLVLAESDIYNRFDVAKINY